jgi:hypothetical protein
LAVAGNIKRFSNAREGRQGVWYFEEKDKSL